jgi:hypothetical protein
MGLTPAAAVTKSSKTDTSCPRLAAPHRLGAVALDGIERGAGEAIPDEGREREGEQVRDHELGEQLAQGLVALVEVHGTDGDRCWRVPAHRNRCPG